MENKSIYVPYKQVEGRKVFPIRRSSNKIDRSSDSLSDASDNSRDFESKRSLTRKSKEKSPTRPKNKNITPKESSKRKGQKFHQYVSRLSRQQIINNGRESRQVTRTKREMDLICEQNPTGKDRDMIIKNFTFLLNTRNQEDELKAFQMIFLSLKGFYMAKQMRKFIQSGVVDRLCELMDYKRPNFIKCVFVLDRIIECESKVIDLIFKRNQIKNIINHLLKGSLDQGQFMVKAFQCVDLLTTLFKSNPQKITGIISIEKILRYCRLWLQKIINKKQSPHKTLQKVYAFLIELAKEIREKWNTYQMQTKNLVISLLTKFNQTCIIRQLQQTQQQMIIIIYFLTQQAAIRFQHTEGDKKYLPNFPVCQTLGHLPQVMKKIVEMTDKRLFETVKMTLRIVAYFSNIAFQEQKDFEKMLGQYLKEEKLKNDTSMVFESFFSTCQQVPLLINNLLRFIQIAYIENPRASHIIDKIIKIFKQTLRSIDGKREAEQQEIQI